MLKRCGRLRRVELDRRKQSDGKKKKEKKVAGIVSGWHSFEDSSEDEDDHKALQEQADSQKLEIEIPHSDSNGDIGGLHVPTAAGAVPLDGRTRKGAVKADLVMIRLILKTIANTLLSHSGGGSQLEEKDRRTRVAQAVRTMDISPAQDDLDLDPNLHPPLESPDHKGQTAVSLSSLAATDKVINFYFNLIVAS